MSIKVQHFNEVDISNIHFSEPKKTRSGSYLLEIYQLGKDNKKEGLFIQTPKLKNVDGIHFNETKAFIDFEFKQEQPELYQFFIDIDEKCIQETHKNSKKWFRKSLPFDIVEEYYKSNIKLGRNHKVPTIRLKLPVSKKQIQTEIYNQQRQKVHFQDVSAGDEMVNVIHIIGLKFLKQQFILETQLLQSKLYKENNQEKQLGYIIKDEEEEFDEDLLPPSPEDNQSVFIDDEISLMPPNEEEFNHKIQETIKEELEETQENDNLLKEELIEETNLTHLTQKQEELLESNKKEELLESNDNIENKQEQPLIENNNNIEEINIDNINYQLTENDKNEITKELNDNKKLRLLNYNKERMDKIQQDILNKQLQLEQLQKDNELFENSDYEFDMEGSFTDFDFRGNFTVKQRDKGMNSESYLIYSGSESGAKKVRIRGSHSDVNIE